MTAFLRDENHVMRVAPPNSTPFIKPPVIVAFRNPAPPFANAKGFMNEVTPWISDYFTNLATAYGSNYNTVPPAEKLKKCQLKKVRKIVSVQSTH